jgi:hypothetical protein
MSKEELQQLWSETMGDKPFPMNRSENSPLDSFYPIDNFIVFMKEGKPISGLGYSTRDGFSLRGGAFTIPEERNSGVYKKVSQEADRIIPTPYIAGFSSSNIDSAKWNQTAKDNGWSIKPTDEELGEYANNPTIKAFKDYYDNHPKGSSWGVKGLSMKKWFSVLKSYRMEMDSAGYNVLDASGKVLNYKGLSRSQAKTFITELQEGKDVSRFTTKPRKSIRGNWFNQLKKIDPTSGGYDPLPMSDIQEQQVDTPFMINYVDGVAILFNAHYHYRYSQRRNTGLTIMTNAIARKFIALEPVLEAWSYIDNDSKNHSHVMFDRLSSPNDVIKRTNPKKTVGDIRNPETGEPITEAVVFHHINDGHDSPDKGKKRDIFYFKNEGIKPNHKQKLGVSQKKRTDKDKPKELVVNPRQPKEEKPKEEEKPKKELTGKRPEQKLPPPPKKRRRPNRQRRR